MDLFLGKAVLHKYLYHMYVYGCVPRYIWPVREPPTSQDARFPSHDPQVSAEAPQLVQEEIDTQECMRALEECRSQLVPSAEGSVVGWVVVSINKWGQEQERVVLLSEQAWTLPWDPWDPHHVWT